jgi:hypothetical protein
MPSINIASNYDSYKWRIYLCSHFLSSWNRRGQLYFTYTKWSLKFSERRYSAWYNLAGELASSTLLLLHTSLSSVKFCISLSEVDYFRALWNETLLQSCCVFYNCICVCIYLKNSLPSSFEVKNEWCSTSTLPRDLHGVCRGHFTFTICFKVSFNVCCAFGGFCYFYCLYTLGFSNQQCSLHWRWILLFVGVYRFQIMSDVKILRYITAHV